MKPEDGHEDSDVMRAAYRRAADRLDERPDPTVRATVLAAARRAVDAPRRTSGRSSMPRWSLSIAAALLVSVMAAVVATNAGRDAPERVTTVARAAMPQAPPAAAATPPVVDRPTPKAASPVPARRVSKAAPQNRSRPEDATRGTTTKDGQADVAPAVEASTMIAPSSSMRSTPAIARSTRAAVAPALRDVLASDPPTPEAWVDRIVKLRASGNAFAADHELDALRRRYPDFVVPSSAFGGTSGR